MNEFNLEIFCDICGSFQPVIFEPLRQDELNQNPWGDILCGRCKLVHKSLKADVPGEIKFVPTKNPTQTPSPPAPESSTPNL